MNLYIAGVNHNDPTCREKSRQWFKQLSDTHKRLPSFVATEWDKGIFAKVKEQRGKILNLAQKKWPHASAVLLDVLKSSLAYEADTHTDIFPDVEVLWLDEGR